MHGAAIRYLEAHGRCFCRRIRRPFDERAAPLVDDADRENAYHKVYVPRLRRGRRGRRRGGDRRRGCRGRRRRGCACAAHRNGRRSLRARLIAARCRQEDN
ncbi:hypothetical protein COU20_01610 [Candidatus Kaiserbacteria bacterium CG10_big_fil_rev_8_21_14_0_10_59_10]|uniref:Uncharacterized protein n=1 Tax=Candidatus Kaiserbacteria bacterium CG10_big_fil_rev_8_21_14_0_10_59_10 TaxID=1974612 RepID=A0A2H0U823_9BACT|nr:MAG: hypothetical protein COU20_01610 [Candidatus Kaiserbacteria bacterium CG10_big_fil_rev_8_21_14_0_10_59_10]